MPRSAIKIGVGSLPGSLGSVPLSLSSEATTGSPLASVIGEPSGLMPLPEPTASLVKLWAMLSTPSGSIVTTKVTSTRSPVSSVPPESKFCVESVNQSALAVGAVPVPAKLLTVRPLAETKALPNCDITSSVNVSPSSETVPVFSSNSVKVTSKLSPLATGSLAVLATPTSGINSGVESSLVPLSPWSLGLSLLGSLPLSESSSTVIGSPLESEIGLPFSSIASPPATTWLLIGSELPLASRSTSTVNCTANESPTANNVAAAESINSVAPLPSHAPSTVMALVASAGEVVSVNPLALIKLAPN